MNIDGIYEIVEMERWETDATDSVASGYITIKGRNGKLHFTCVDGLMEIRKVKERYLFTWEGNNEGDPVSGEGVFTCSGDTMNGRIAVHGRDDIPFVAVKASQVKMLPRRVNRGVLVVKAGEPFGAWLASLRAPDHVSTRDINYDGTAYLIPGFGDNRQKDRILRKIYLEIFAERLRDSCVDERRWPQERTLALFKEWFELEFHSITEDLAADEAFEDE